MTDKPGEFLCKTAGEDFRAKEGRLCVCVRKRKREREDGCGYRNRAASEQLWPMAGGVAFSRGRCRRLFSELGEEPGSLWTLMGALGERQGVSSASAHYGGSDHGGNASGAAGHRKSHFVVRMRGFKGKDSTVDCEAQGRFGRCVCSERILRWRGSRRLGAVPDAAFLEGRLWQKTGGPWREVGCCFAPFLYRFPRHGCGR